MKFPIVSMVVLAAGTVALADQPVKEAKEMQQIAREARTAEQHARVADEYRLRADSLEQKAQAHEKKAADLHPGNSYRAMEHKWPGLAQGPRNREIELAAKARRQAGEAREAAANHLDQATKKREIETEP